MLRGETRSDRLLRHLQSRGPVAASAITAFEVLRGSRTAWDETRTLTVLSQFALVSVGMDAASRGAKIVRDYPGIFGAANTLPDAIIAGCAAVAGFSLVTLNSRQFNAINEPDLRIVVVDQNGPDWTTGIP